MNKLIILALITFMIGLILTTCPKANAGWNRGEMELLNLAYQEGRELGHPEILQILMMSETVVGRLGRYGDDKFDDWKMHCFGVMQIQFNTARMTIDNWTNYILTNKELVKRLRYDDAFCIEIAGVYVKRLLKMHKGNMRKAILSYNVGPGNVLKYGFTHDPNGYLNRAMNYLKGYIVPFNNRQGNGTIIEYKVKKYDTFFKIAANVLCEGKRWREIQALNPEVKPTNLVVGSTLLIKR